MLRLRKICLLLGKAGFQAPGFEEVEDMGMKLHDAIRKTVREYGVRVISEKRLIFILADLKAFDEYPAVKQVLEAVVSGGAGRELARLFLEEDRDWFLSYAGNLRKSLSVRNHFREDLADYAVGSILFGLGVQESVTTPSDHGFDPVEHGRGAVSPGAGGRKARSEEEVKDRTEESAGGGVRERGAGVTRHEHSEQKAEEPQGSSPEVSGSGSAVPRNAGAKSTSSSLKWMIAAVLLAGTFAGGWLASSSPREDGGVSAPQTAGSSDGSAGVHGGLGTQGTGAASMGVVSEKPGENGVLALSAQEEYVPGKAYYLGYGGIVDDTAETERLRKSAEQGNALAQNNLGVMYAEGRGVSHDYSEAVKWLRRSAEQVNPAGEANFGMMYQNGRGVDRNYAEALGWYRKSAGQGDAVGLVRLGWMYRDGLEVPKDDAAAFKLFKQAAGQGLATAQDLTGYAYFFGEGTDQNYKLKLPSSKMS